MNIVKLNDLSNKPWKFAVVVNKKYMLWEKEMILL